MKTRENYWLAISIAIASTFVATAQEQTGKVIEKLVTSVDQQLTALEELAGNQSLEKERLRSELDIHYARYEEAESPVSKAGIRSEIVNLLAQLNSLDRAEVNTTLETIVKVSETMRQLAAIVHRSPELNPVAIQEHQQRMTRFVRNAARLVRAIDESPGAPQAGLSTAALKNSLTMLYRQATDPLTGAGGALEQLQTTIKTLDDVAIQLNILHGMLENERTTLTTATHVQTVDLALLRLSRARLGADNVVDIPLNKHEDILKRIRQSWRPISDSSGSLLGSSQTSDPITFDQIASDEFDGIR